MKRTNWWSISGLVVGLAGWGVAVGQDETGPPPEVGSQAGGDEAGVQQEEGGQEQESGEQAEEEESVVRYGGRPAGLGGRFALGAGSEGLSSLFGEPEPRDAVDALVDLVEEMHIDFCELPVEEVEALLAVGLRQFRDLYPDRAKAAGIPELIDDASWDDFLDWSLGSEATEDIEPDQLELRVRFFTDSVMATVADPFSQLIRGGIAGLVMQQAFPFSTGVSVKASDSGVVVAAVMGSSDAGRKGLRAGDSVVAVNGRATADLPIADVQEMLQQPCTVSAMRDGWATPVDIPVHAVDAMGAQPVGAMIGEDVAYVRYPIFMGGAIQVRDQFKRLIKAGATAMILDLRGNPGGLIADAWLLADLFLDRGQLVTRIEMPGETDAAAGGALPEQMVASNIDVFEGIPLTVMVDGSSASASEMFSCAVQDHSRALIVGETTYGKGVGQMAMPVMVMSELVGGGESAAMSALSMDFVYLTVLRFYSPDDHWIHGRGVRPDLRATATDSVAAIEARVRLWEDPALLTVLRSFAESGEFDRDSLQTAKDTPPEWLREGARQAGVDLLNPDDERALLDVAAAVLGMVAPEVDVSPQRDPVLQKALKAVAVQRMRTGKRE